MRLVKPPRVGLIKRSLLWGGRTLLSFGLVTAFPLAAPRRIMKEGDMWEAITPLLGGGILDSGEPKRRGELVVHGRYFSPGGQPVLQHGVRVALGPIDKALRVTGRREWATDDRGRVVATAPQALTDLPIEWKYAFGGPAYPENPDGLGHWPEDTRAADARYPLPMLEYPGDLMVRPDDVVAPAGLGPRDIMLPSRQAHAGTYDRFWADNHAPGLAANATLDLFQTAAPDQQFPGFIAGEETFAIENMHPELAAQHGRLPGVRARAFVRRAGPPARLEELPLATDTCVMFPGIALGLLIHRGSLWVSAFDHPEIDLLLGAFEWQEHEARPQRYYEDDLARRLDPEDGVRLGLDFTSLSPKGWVEPPSDKAAWFKVMKPRAFTIPPSLQARIAEGQAQLARMIPADRMAALARTPPPDETPTEAALRAELAAIDVDGGLKNPRTIKPRLDRIKALSRQVADERTGRAEGRLRRTMARHGLDYDAVKAAALARPQPSPLQVMADLDRAADRLAAHAPPAIGDRLGAARLAPHAARVAQAMDELASLKARGRAAIGHAMPVPPPVPPAEAARRIAGIRALLRHDGTLARGLFAGLDLSGFSFADRDLTETDFAACNLTGADFTGADLTRTNFARANLTAARFTGAGMVETNLGGALLDHTDLRDTALVQATLSDARGRAPIFAGARLEGIVATGARFQHPSFAGAGLKDVKFLDAELDGADFDGAAIDRLVLLNCRADRATFRDAFMNRPTFVKSLLRGADFSRASIDRLSTVSGVDLGHSRFDHVRMPAASLVGVGLAGTRWTAANVGGALFNNADLHQAVFSSSLLRGALFMRARMTEAQFYGCDCADASFIRADLRWVSLRDVSLFGADLTDARLDDMVINGGMIDNTLLAGRNFPS